MSLLFEKSDGERRQKQSGRHDDHPCAEKLPCSYALAFPA
jgi:hypothetical protein